MTEKFRWLLNKSIDKIIGIEFEYSPGRGNSNFTSDNTAFYVFIVFSKMNTNKKSFLGIEVKYTETLNEDRRKRIDGWNKPRYEELTTNSGMFKSNSVDGFKTPQLWQIWRDHLLSISMLKKHNEFGEYDEGYFIYLYPSENTKCKNGIDKYRNYLNSGHNVLEIHLEDIISEMTENIREKWTEELSKRYIGK
jgi:hypothetical protein